MKTGPFTTQQDVVQYLSSSDDNQVRFISTSPEASVLGFKKGKLYNFTSNDFVSAGFEWFKRNADRWEKYLGTPEYKYKALVVIQGKDTYEFISNEYYKTVGEAIVMANKETSVSSGRSTIASVQLIKATKQTFYRK